MASYKSWADFRIFLLRKHEARHTKPYKCPLPECERNEKGFTSKNDLSRHMNSVHKGLRGNGSATGYNCLYGSCREKKKIYYRLDNFRNHLKKLHAPQEGLEEFIRRCVCARVFRMFFCLMIPISLFSSSCSLEIRK